MTTAYESKTTAGSVSGSAQENRSQRVLRLDPKLFNKEQIRLIHMNLHVSHEFTELIHSFSHQQLSNLLESLISDAVKYYKEYHGVTTIEKTIRNRCENLLDYKGRTGCVEPIESCLNEGCLHLRPSCAIRKLREDIFSIIKIFEARKNRSGVPHVAIELFFKQIIENYNCIGLILADKFGTPKIFTTDGSGISPIITEGSRRLSDAIIDREFRFSQKGEAYLVFNQKFPIDLGLAGRLQPIENNPDLIKFVKKITFSSVGFEIAHERMVLSAIYLGDNMLGQFLEKAIAGIERIKIETEPELRFRSGFGKR